VSASFSIVPDLVEAIVAAAKNALPMVTVTDGQPTTLEPADYLAICFNDGGPAVQSSMDPVNNIGDGIINETGTIWCLAFSWIGDDDAATARRRAYQTVDGLSALCLAQGATDPAFGVERGMWVVCGQGDVELDLFPGNGWYAGLKFPLYYEGRP